MQNSRPDIGGKASPNKTAEGTLSPDSALWLDFETASDMMSLASVEPGPKFRLEALNATCRHVLQTVATDANSADWVGQTLDDVLPRLALESEIVRHLLRGCEDALVQLAPVKLQ